MRYKHKVWVRKVLVVFLVGVVLGAIGYGLMYFNGTEDMKTDVQGKQTSKEVVQVDVVKNPLSKEGLTLVDVSLSSGTIILEANCSALAMTTTIEKTYSIQRGADKVYEVRPNEHDIVSEVMEHYGLDVAFVKIRELRDEVYYADLIVEHENSVLALDVKPSDAIAVAERFGAETYVDTTILTEFGQNTC